MKINLCPICSADLDYSDGFGRCPRNWVDNGHSFQILWTTYYCWKLPDGRSLAINDCPDYTNVWLNSKCIITLPPFSFSAMGLSCKDPVSIFEKFSVLASYQ